MKRVDIILAEDDSTGEPTNTLQGKWSISKGWEELLKKLFPKAFSKAQYIEQGEEKTVLVLTYRVCGSLIRAAKYRLQRRRLSQKKMSKMDDRGQLSNISELGIVEIMLRNIEPWFNAIKKATQTSVTPPVPA